MRRPRSEDPKLGRAARFCLRLLKAPLIAATFAAPIAQAADAAKSFPERPLRLVSPFAAGGNTDMIGRMIAPRLSERLGQNVIVENRPGAGGIIGASHEVKHRAGPDRPVIELARVLARR